MNSSPAHGHSAPRGFSTMSPAMGEMQHYQRYLYSKIKPWVRSRILEIGVGHGLYTGLLLEAGEVLAADIDQGCLDHVATLYSGNPRLSTTVIDLNDAESIARCAAFQPDTIVCVNVLEHIERDARALRGLLEITQPGGRLVLIVPAHPRLYGRMDQEAGHFRRYTRGGLARLLPECGWQQETLGYLNAFGAAGWWFHNRLRHSAGLADAAVNQQMRSADRWLPRLARLTDPCLSRWLGLSILAVGIRPASAAP